MCSLYHIRVTSSIGKFSYLKLTPSHEIDTRILCWNKQCEKNVQSSTHGMQERSEYMTLLPVTPVCQMTHECQIIMKKTVTPTLKEHEMNYYKICLRSLVSFPPVEKRKPTVLGNKIHTNNTIIMCTERRMRSAFLSNYSMKCSLFGVNSAQ